MSTLRILLCCMCLFYVGHYIWTRPIGFATDKPINVTSDPIQTPVFPEDTPFIHNGLTIKPVAHYQIAARVLSTERYYFDRPSIVSPIDLALGWGTVSDPEFDDKCADFLQGARFYEFYTKPSCTYSIPYIIEHSANNHIIPATKNLKHAFYRIKKNDLVLIEGKLVNVQKEMAFYWHSSTTRKDTGNGACEIIYAEKLIVNGREYE